MNLTEVSGKMTFATNVTIIDISSGGVALKADRRLNIDNEYALKIESGRGQISLKGLVVWSSLSGAEKGPKGDIVPIYTAGMQFTDMTPAKMAWLKRFIEEHKTGDEEETPHGRRLDVRFRIMLPEKTVLQFPENYRVLKISLGGMLIESDHGLDIESRLPMELSLRDNESLSFLGRVASCHAMDADGPKHHIGIEFLELTDDRKKALNAFIAYCAGREGDAETAPLWSIQREDAATASRTFTEKVESLYRSYKKTGFYEILGIREYADEGQIRAAFLALAQELDPDKIPGVPDEVKLKVREIFTHLSAAYSAVMEPRKKVNRKGDTRTG